MNLYAFDCDSTLDRSNGAIPLSFLDNLRQRGHIVCIVSPSPNCHGLPYEYFISGPDRLSNLKKEKEAHPDCTFYYYFTDNAGEENLAVPSGFINLDMQLLKGVDVIAYIDPFRPIIPFRDDSFEYIYFNNGPEHILNINQLIQEMYRISKDNAEWYLLTPGYLDPNSWNDPTHYSHWTRSILQFYTKEGFDSRRYEPALLEYKVNGDESHGLEFFVRVVKEKPPVSIKMTTQ